MTNTALTTNTAIGSAPGVDPIGSSQDSSAQFDGAQIDGVLFDIDDTLVDTRGAFAHALTAVCARYLPGLTSQQNEQALAMWRSDVNGHYRAYTRGEVTAREQRIARANELHAHFGGEHLDDAGFDAWDLVFQSGFRAAWTAFADARGVLDHLSASGLKLGALSNAPMAMQVDKMAATGLGDLEILVTLDTFGVGKPHAKVFLEACRLLGTDPQRTMYVGDELDIDARGAAAVGLAGVWLDRPGTRRGGVHEEDAGLAARHGVHVIESLDQVTKLLGIDGPA